MVMKLMDSLSSHEVGRQHHISHSRVLEWKLRFEVEGLEGLRNKPRPGGAKMEDGEHKEGC